MHLIHGGIKWQARHKDIPHLQYHKLNQYHQQPNANYQLIAPVLMLNPVPIYIWDLFGI